MKSRAYMLVAALLVYMVGSYAVAQNSGTQNQTSQGTQASQQTPTPPTFPPTDTTQKPADSKQPAAAADQPVPQVANPPKETHNGDKNDIDAIGNRKIGGKGLGNWYSLEKEIAMGKEYAQ